MVDRTALKTDLARATDADQLRLEYQPVANLVTGEIVGVEALVRWLHPTLGLLPPADFIPLAEETGEITAVGLWVLATATAHAAQWRATLPHCANLWVAVNLSPFQILNSDGMAALHRILADPGGQPDHLILEITESALAADTTTASTPSNTSMSASPSKTSAPVTPRSAH